MKKKTVIRKARDVGWLKKIKLAKNKINLNSKSLKYLVGQKLWLQATKLRKKWNQNQTKRN